MFSTFKTFILAVLINFSFLAGGKVAIAEKIVNAEFKCMPYEGGHIRGYSHLTENPFRTINPTEIIVVVKGAEVQVKHMHVWETLKRDYSDVPWVAATSENLFTQHIHVKLFQHSDTYVWKFNLVRNGSIQVIATGTCQKK